LQDFFLEKPKMELQEIIASLQLSVLCGTGDKLDGPVHSGCVSDMLSEVMAHAPRDCLWITHQTNENVIAIAYFKELAAILLPNNLTVEEELLEKARVKNIPVLRSSESAYDIAGKLYAMGIRGHR
jgi:hypothetical protein